MGIVRKIEVFPGPFDGVFQVARAAVRYDFASEFSSGENRTTGSVFYGFVVGVSRGGDEDTPRNLCLLAVRCLCTITRTTEKITPRDWPR